MKRFWSVKEATDFCEEVEEEVVALHTERREVRERLVQLARRMDEDGRVDDRHLADVLVIIESLKPKTGE